MSKAICIILSLCFAFSHGMAQRNEFLKQAKAALLVPDQLSQIAESQVGNAQLDPLNFNKADFEAAVRSYLQKNSKNKQFQLHESEHLQKLCAITAKTINNAYFENKKNNFNKIVRKAQHATLSKFGLIEVYSFEVPLIKAKRGEFFHDRKGAEGALNLYYNLKKPKKLKEGEEKPAPEPVLLFTEAEIFRAVEEKLKKHKIYNDLKSGNYYAAGVHIEVNRKTLFRKKVPMLRVIVSLGSKRLHLVQKNYKL